MYPTNVCAVEKFNMRQKVWYIFPGNRGDKTSDGVSRTSASSAVFAKAASADSARRSADAVCRVARYFVTDQTTNS